MKLARPKTCLKSTAATCRIPSTPRRSGVTSPRAVYANRKSRQSRNFAKPLPKRKSRKAQRRSPKSKRDWSIERGTAPRAAFRVYSPRLLPTFYDRFVDCAERWPDNVALELQRRPDAGNSEEF